MEDSAIFDKDEFQRYLLEFMISDTESFTRVQSIVKDVYFNDELRPVVRLITEYANKHNTIPLPEQIEAQTGVKVSKIDGITVGHVEDFLGQIESFCRYRALQKIVYKGPELIAEGRGADLEREIKDAMTISLITDLGVSYFSDVRERLNRLKDRSNFVTTGWKSLDRRLGGGFTRGSLNIFAGGSGSGKSLFLQNIALNWSLLGMNVVYITLELSEDLTSGRVDQMVTGMKSSDILRQIDAVALKVDRFKKEANGKRGAGDLKIKKMSEAGTTANEIRAYLKEYEIKTGIRPDALLVDYLDLMHPNNQKVDVSSLFTKDKYVSEELRAIAGDWDIPVVSASQLNRASVDAQEFDHSHIAGGISKINTADNVFGIFTSMSMREGGRYQIQFLKTRSSSAVGQKAELAYDPGALRITDPVEDDDAQGSQQNNGAVSQAVTSLASNPSTTAPAVSPGFGAREDINAMLERFNKKGAG